MSIHRLQLVLSFWLATAGVLCGQSNAQMLPPSNANEAGNGATTSYGTDKFTDKGYAAAMRRDAVGAVKYYTDSLNKARPTAQTYINRAMAYARLGEYDRAMADYESAISVNNDSQHSIMPAIYFSRATVYLRMKDYARAETGFAYCINKKPDYLPAYTGRAKVRMELGRLAEARRDLMRVLKIKPEDMWANHVMLALCFKEGDAAKARKTVDAWADRAEKAPRPEKIYNSVAWILATSPHAELRDGKRAVAYATKACELTEWKYSPAIDTLAAAFAEAGDFASAVKWEENYLARPDISETSRQEGAACLEAYRNSKPCTDDGEDEFGAISIRVSYD